ncbi:MAG TPA: alpha/beta hydrolase [Alphaproteobacteria bacterium]
MNDVTAPAQDYVVAGGTRLECVDIPGRAPDLPAIVMLHEGLGSVSLWRDVPATLAAATGRRVFVYSRRGYGKSDPAPLPRPVDYMHDEAFLVLPEVLQARRIERPILVGHSDGASIAILHAARHPVSGLVLMAPHVFVEDLSIASIAEAKTAYETTDLRARLARHHDDVDNAFWGWNDIWLNPAFRSWNIEAYLPQVTAPVLIIQGVEDQYGTIAQVDAIERQVRGPARRLMLSPCRHSPHRDQPEQTLAAITKFVAELT